MFELMKKMKLCAQKSHQEAKNMVLQNPQLAYALLQAQVSKDKCKCPILDIQYLVDPCLVVAYLLKNSWGVLQMTHMEGLCSQLLEK
ncbi:hypothetical protein A6R68_05620 [Neotoma lepida]|uniref:Cleavage stimulation factor subunit 2 hinge domain-containing protein n=1 Tax=Neotoma lepida TaxID=56216 RepID=A0A1A6GI02_NEOLE|nr:hypothetical protein A6R68_05620 [Neotoma lepida]